MVIISSLLPNPEGKNPFGEWIKIKNTGHQSVDITGYKIRDLSGKQFILRGIIKPGEEKKFFYRQTKIILNNQNEIVFLYNKNGDLIDKLSYYKSYPNKIIYREDNNFKENILNKNLIGRLNSHSISTIILPFFLIIISLTFLFFYLIKYIIEKNEEDNQNKIA